MESESDDDSYCEIEVFDLNISDEEDGELMTGTQTLCEEKGSQPYLFEPHVEVNLTCEVEESSSMSPQPEPEPNDRLQDKSW